MAAALPRRVTAGLPAVLACTLALLLAAHVLKGASTMVSGEAPLGLLRPHVASEDNLFSAVARLWRSQAYCIVVLVALLSGVWPYAKLLLTLLCVKRVEAGADDVRSALGRLRVLETLGKYSFADVFLVCCNCVIFDISTGGKYRIMGLFNLEVNLWMQIHLACVLLFVAVTLSVFVTHWAISELEALEASSDERVDEQADLEERSMEVAAAASLPDSSPGLRPYQFLALAAAAAGAALLLAGASMPVVVVDRGGFLGKLIRPREQRDVRLSIASVFRRMLASSSEHGGHDGLTLITAVLFVCLSLLAPLLELLCLAAASVAASRAKRLALCAADWCHSFACVEILLLVAAAIVLELQTTIAFNLGDECRPFESIMDDSSLLRLAGLGFAASSECFAASPRFARGGAALLLSVACRACAWRALGGRRGAPGGGAKSV